MKTMKNVILGLTLTLLAPLINAQTASYDSTVCEGAVNDLGHVVCARMVDYLYYNWKGDVNDFDSLEHVNFCIVTGTMVGVYGADTIAQIMSCQIEQGTHARLFNMSFSKNKRRVIDFAQVLTHYVDYAQTGFDKESMVGDEVSAYDVHKGVRVTGELLFVNVDEGYGVVDRNGRAYKCNVYTIKRLTVVE